MKVLHRYLAREILVAVFFVLLVFLVLLPFFDLPNELHNVGRGNYHYFDAFFFIILGLPTYAYQLMPIAVLIGSIYALSQLAARSEFTIMRAASLSTWGAISILIRIGLMFVVFTFLVGEFIAPASSQLAEKFKLQAIEGNISGHFQSGWWTKDVIRKNGETGEVIGTRFLNVGEVRPNGTLLNFKLYEFDLDFHMRKIIAAEVGYFIGHKMWRLQNVTVTHFLTNSLIVADTWINRPNLTPFDVIPSKVMVDHKKTLDMVSEITPSIISVVFTDPEKMSIHNLFIYIQHLAENGQNSELYKIAFWNKIFYPFSILVMMALALPFAYLHFRSGGTSIKIFSGIMIGVGFVVLNNLFMHLGILNTWPAPAIALMPSAFFLILAAIAIWRVGRT